MIGLLAAMLGKGARARTLGHELSHALSRIRAAGDEEALPHAVDVPGPPPVPRWNSATSPLPDLSLVEAGMRPITGGRRRSF